MSKTQKTGTSLLRSLLNAWSWLFLVLILGFFEIYAQLEAGNTFLFRAYNLQSIAVASSQILLLALGLTLVIVAGHIDLSIGFTTGLSAVVMALVIRAAGPDAGLLAVILAMLVGVGAAIVVGLVNGWLVAKLDVPSFIGTLGTYGVARGAALIVAGGATVSIRSDEARAFGNGDLLGVPIPVVVAIVLAVGCHYLLTYTKFGVHTYALGANRASVERAGVDVNKLLIKLFVISAVTAGIGGLVYTGRFSAGAANAGEPILLYAVAAVFIGGASLTGGQGTIIGTVIGAIIIAVIQFGLVFTGLPPYWQFVAVGLVIIVAVLVDQSKSKLTGGRV
ncbi:ABC transporter permease [Donghicola tyrosinivorans]|uniref:Autoinducer 2 import system permease protein LsrD n=1 Tax=Donghicola tyrosinivorans TaxID=1652492 RepID=A0A2T0WEC0_9RHOB|nr:ribose ABC transporter [Donghicola tyrosinivorans]PRY85058.1 ribose transport system permease protein [Donghicola tyrosinivorans]